MAAHGLAALERVVSRQNTDFSDIPTIMKIRDGFVLRDVCGETVIAGEGLGAVDFGKLLVLNPTAAWLWNEAQQVDDFTPEWLTDRLCEEYDVEPEVARADVDELLAKWQSLGVIE